MQTREKKYGGRMELLRKRRKIEASCHLEKSAKERWVVGLGKEKGPEGGMDIVLYNENLTMPPWEILPERAVSCLGGGVTGPGQIQGV